MFGACMVASSGVATCALVALAGLILLLTNRHAPCRLACTHPGLVGKRVVITSDSRVSSTEDSVVFLVENGKISVPPVLVIPKRSKYDGKRVSEVLAALNSKFGPQYVHVIPWALRNQVDKNVVTDSTVVVLEDSGGIAREVRVPKRWREADDVEGRLALVELVGKTPVLLEDDLGVPPGDPVPESVLLFTRYGLLTRLPVVG